MNLNIYQEKQLKHVKADPAQYNYNSKLDLISRPKVDAKWGMKTPWPNIY